VRIATTKGLLEKEINENKSTKKGKDNDLETKNRERA
jgi:hypothetical protein